MPRKPRIVTPFGDLVLLVLLFGAVLVMDRCSTPMRPRFAMAPMPTADRTSTEPTAARS